MVSRHRLRSTGLLVLVLLATCDRANRDGPDSPVARAPERAVLAECYRSPASVMGRTTPLAGHSTVAPGWLRFDSSATADSGAARIVDADGASVETRWRRMSGDSIEISGFDDFMAIELRAVLADSALRGTGLVTSDADVQRDAAGRLEPLRREWPLRARAASCSEAPALPG